MPTLSQVLQVPAAEAESLEARTLFWDAVNDMARVPVAIPVGAWAGFTTLEKQIVAEVYEAHQVALAVISGTAAQSKEAAAAAFAGVDAGDRYIRMQLEEMNRRALR